MITAGDERGRTQRGNNNAFCHDNELSWVSWDDATPSGSTSHDLTQPLLALRAEHPVLRQRHFFEGTPIDGSGPARTSPGCTPSGAEMTDSRLDGPRQQPRWASSSPATSCRSTDNKGDRRHDTSYLIWLHAGADPVDVQLPSAWANRYVEVLRTDRLDATDSPSHDAGATVRLDSPHPRPVRSRHLRPVRTTLPSSGRSDNSAGSGRAR